MIGAVVRAHGLRGALRVAPLTDRPGRFEGMRECVLWHEARDVREPRRLRSAHLHGNAVLVELEGVDTVEQASALVGWLLAVPETEALPLPPGHFYPWQLEGCQVVTTGGDEVGRVTRVEQNPGHDLWVVQGPSREHLIPAVPEIVRDVDLAARRVVIDPPDGLLEL